MRSSSQITKQSQEQFLQNAKKNQALVEEIRTNEKELFKRSKKWVQNIAVAAHTGISVSETLKSYSSKFEKSDISNIQRVCVALGQCGEIVDNFVRVLDRLQLDLDKYLCESLRSLIDGELAMVTNGPKLDSIRTTGSSTSPKLSQAVANIQMAIDKFEIESLSRFCNVFDSFDNLKEGMISVNILREKAKVAKKQQEQLQAAYEETEKIDSTTYRNYFGIPLKKLLEDEGRVDAQIPLGLEKALKYLFLNGLNKEGLFRLSSTPDKLNFAKMKFLATNYSHEDPYLVANLVKLFIKEIPGNLIPKNAIAVFQKWDNEIVAGINTETREIDPVLEKKIALQIHSDIALTLPPEHLTCLKYLVSFCSHLVKSEKSKMTIEAISTCVAPNVFYSDPKLEGPTLLNYSKQINRLFSFILRNILTIFPSSKRCFSARKKSVFMHNPEEIEMNDGLVSVSPMFSERSSPKLIISNQIDQNGKIITQTDQHSTLVSPCNSKVISLLQSSRLSMK
ncbi:RhoGAP domain containing protein [Entamoeba histolytica HM-1:IMSS-B]|uniref:RhoGAP domain containing protein n=6 Tax=Entamoeba histolytica TaxID=5759 RepID=C4M9W9_ENTH1|nr:RhoGAP domain containing protein [Entamoeba histolytica HM-1:IMSS]EMD43979.1 RhoGAP domain containing protein [Entamoeba histolytica KU27]EMH72656.1 RhoGAP domain containing protein [Entamoeba histolytica HM-1:IMSS-B]EMS13435.1 RhoGAP domain containing protein [Entamoeba histolytica HM-3:IMSS]ENY63064.1 RhoGAP domain containing protein [Entamoeba histolytica HM-1:IMSS-A]GAT98528.1 rhogap domain containing protein [Entamoeba histolytica]|eukprot:XP_651930.1 RhoGAP domain containing protein [Entamoeba histolytica HM-1:IMSS]